MKKACLIVSLVAFGLAVRGEEGVIRMESAGLSARSYDGRIGRKLGAMLSMSHVLQRGIDDEISQRAWTNLVTYYDFDHSVFLKSDLDRLSVHEKTLDDELRAGDVSFGYDVHNLYVSRLRERVGFATNLIQNATWDFSTNEMYRIRRKDAAWPESREQAEDYWRRRIKNEVLVMTINHELDKSTNTLDVVDKLVKKYRQYLTVLAEPDEEMVMQNYMSAFARAYDPHSDYMSPATKEEFEMEMNLTLCGVGAVLSVDDGALKIEEIMPGGPIDIDGRIHEGDKIIGVRQGDGEMEDIMWQPMRKSIHKIRGKKGSRVTLEIIPRSDPSGLSKKEIELVRDEIKLEDNAATGHVERVTLGGDEYRLGYVLLPSFYGTMDKKPFEEGFRSAAMDVAEQICDFNDKGVQGMILDLRGNGGGSLLEAVRLSALFVAGGPVVQIRDTNATYPLPIPPGNPVAFKRPLIVLTDRASASASEIVAGHLRDVGRALVVGDIRTHGKGTVQTVNELNRRISKYGSCKITTARFYRIDGRSTQVEGVGADIHLPSSLDALDIGEDKLMYALPFTRIEPAEYTRVGEPERFVPELKKLSDERLKDNARYQKHLANVNGIKAISEREEVSLAYDIRKDQMVADRELRETDDDEDSDDEESSSKRRRKRNAVRDDDVVLQEAYNILADYIRLVRENAEISERIHSKLWLP